MVEVEGKQYDKGAFWRGIGAAFPIVEPQVAVESPSGRLGLVVRDHVTGRVLSEKKGTVIEMETDKRELGKMLREASTSRWQRRHTTVVYREVQDTPEEPKNISVTHEVRSWRHPLTKNKIVVSIPESVINNFAQVQQSGDKKAVDAEAQKLTEDYYGKFENEVLRYGHKKYHQRFAHWVNSAIVGYPAGIAGRFIFDNAVGKEIPEVGLATLIQRVTGVDVFSINSHLTDFLHSIQQLSFLARDTRTLIISGSVAAGLLLTRTIFHRKLYNHKKKKFLEHYHFEPNSLPVAQVDPI